MSRSIIVALVVFFPVAISVMIAIRGIDRRLLEMARSYRVTRRQRIVLVEIPAALPGIVGGLRIGITLAVVGAIVAEWTGGEQGLGVLINLARGSLFDIPLLFATLVADRPAGDRALRLGPAGGAPRRRPDLRQR